MNCAVTSNFNTGDGFRIAWLKTNRGPSRNIETIAVSFDAVEVELRVGLDQMVMRPDLSVALVKRVLAKY